MAGYSGTPLVKKLGVKEGCRMLLVNAPAGFTDLLSPLPAEVSIVARSIDPVDLAILFTQSSADLTKRFSATADEVDWNGMLWIAWPKKASGIVTDLTDNVVRTIGLEAGLVDVKVCAIDDTWSGLKFVYRRADRPKAARG